MDWESRVLKSAVCHFKSCLFFDHFAILMLAIPPHLYIHFPACAGGATSVPKCADAQSSTAVQTCAAGVEVYCILHSPRQTAARWCTFRLAA